MLTSSCKHWSSGWGLKHKVLIYSYIEHYSVSPRRNWDSPNPSPARECALPPPGPQGGGRTRLRLGGRGSPNSDDWRKSLALCLNSLVSSIYCSSQNKYLEEARSLMSLMLKFRRSLYKLSQREILKKSFASALISMRIRIQHFRSMLIRDLGDQIF